MKLQDGMSFSTRDKCAGRRTATSIVGTVLLLLLTPTDAVWGRGKPTASPPPSPDIVYMMLGGRSVNPSTELRGLALSADGLSATDMSLVKGAFNRDPASIAWAPDGSRFAWLQNGSIMAASPGKAPTVLYDPAAGIDRPKADMGGDGLAWGPHCGGGTALVFKSYQPYGVFLIRMDDAGVPSEPEPLLVIQQSGIVQGMALSPKGRYLAVAGEGDAFPDSGVSLVPICGDHTPTLLASASDLVGESGFMDIPSMDWSRQGERLVISMTTSGDPGYPWRDLKVLDLAYSWNGSDESIAFARVWRVDLDPVFGAASSEHSPQWGPGNANDPCQRIAFSQSAGVSDGSDSNGRRLFLLDIGEGGLGGCGINAPLELSSKSPRALDWK